MELCTDFRAGSDKIPFAKFILPLMHFNCSPAKRNIQLSALLSMLVACTGEAQALGLGEIKVHSRLGAFFQAEIQLIESPGDNRLASDCFRLSNSGESDTGIPLLIRGRISVERLNGQSRLLITSDQTVNEPVLQVNLRASCGSEVVRSYTVLIDPASPPQLAKQARISLPQANKLPAPEKPLQPAPSEKAYPNTWQTAQGESAQSISKSLFPRQPSAQRRFLAALKAENPQLDLGEDGETPLDAGTALTIPDTRRRAFLPASGGIDEKSAAKESTSKALPNPVRREKSAALKPAGRMANRLVISGDADEASSGSEASLRLSTELSTRFSSKVSENSRTLLRLEYKLLSALYVQAEQQLAMAEQVRNLEASFEEMRLATESTAHQTETAMAATAKSISLAETPALGALPQTPPVTAISPSQAPAVTVEQAKAKPEESFSWSLEILIVLSLIGALSWAFARRSRKNLPEPAAVAADDDLCIPPPAASAESHDPRAAEAEHEAPQPVKASGIMPDIVLDDALPPPPDTINFEKQDRPVKHLEIDETGDYRTVIELADIMVCFGRIKGATQALEEFLARDPGAALVPWMKLLEVFRANDMREEFETYALKLREHFNVAPASWELAGESLREPISPVDESNISIEDLLQKLPTIGTLPHIRENILKSWDSSDGLAYLTHLLRDTRDGKRSGFPLVIARELQFLLELLENRYQNKT